MSILPPLAPGESEGLWTAVESATSLAGSKTPNLRAECEDAREPVTAEGAESACTRLVGPKTGFTNRQPRNVYHGGTATTTSGGKQLNGEACGDTAGPGDHWIILRNNPGPGGPNWGPVTAEDDPPSPSRGCGDSDRTNRFQYSGARGWKQRRQGATNLRRQPPYPPQGSCGVSRQSRTNRSEIAHLKVRTFWLEHSRVRTFPPSVSSREIRQTHL